MFIGKSGQINEYIDGYIDKDQGKQIYSQAVGIYIDIQMCRYTGTQTNRYIDI